MSYIYGKVSSKKGFYIGDICYALRDDIYDDFWGKENGYKDGLFVYNKDVVGNEFIVAGTKYGDGYYTDIGDEHGFPVDAGVLGIVPLELVDETKSTLGDGMIYKGSGTAIMEAKNGDFKFTLPNGKEFEVETDIE